MEHKTIALSGVKVHYVEAGQGPVVLLLHGLGSSLDTCRRNVEPLADAGFTVLAPDLPGHGDSEKPDALDYGPRTAVDFSGQFLSALGVERASLVGTQPGDLWPPCSLLRIQRQPADWRWSLPEESAARFPGCYV